jgi:hypothetical protein
MMPGAKASILFGLYAALKGRSSTVTQAHVDTGIT